MSDSANDVGFGTPICIAGNFAISEHSSEPLESRIYLTRKRGWPINTGRLDSKGPKNYEN
jgi:hypothetical protein